MSNAALGQYKRIVQFFWDPEPKNNRKSPIWCLGKQYANDGTTLDTNPAMPAETTLNGAASLAEQSSSRRARRDSNASSKFDEDLAYEESKQHEVRDNGWPISFVTDFESRIWFTYRSNFPPIPRSPLQDTATLSLSARLRNRLADSEDFTSDTGWGCMIRSGQCVLANAMLFLRFGRDWQRGQDEDGEKRLLALFADDMRAPFSIHRFVEHGAAACGKHPGEWFGPSATAQCIQALSHNSFETSGLRVYVTKDGSDVYKDSFLQVAKSSEGTFTPILILLGIRLGIERVTPAYWDALKAALQMRQSVGIAGGRPSSSHYFVGVQDSSLFYLDPHHTRPTIPFPQDPLEYTKDDVNTYHTRRLRLLDLTEMDPSMLMAFLIRDEKDWEDWLDGIKRTPGEAVIHVWDHEPNIEGVYGEREGALDEVETLDEDDEDEEERKENAVTI